MAHQQEHSGALRIIIEQDAGFVAWLSGQFAAIHQRLDNAFKHLETSMTAQTDKLIADVTALIDEAVKDITAAIAAAQNTSPDPAIDALDARVTTTTQQLKDAIAGLTPAPAGNAPAPSSGSSGSGL